MHESVTPQPDESSAFTLEGAEIFVQRQGAQTLVFIHGWPDTCRLWDGAVNALRSQPRPEPGRLPMPG